MIHTVLPTTWRKEILEVWIKRSIAILEIGGGFTGFINILGAIQTGSGLTFLSGILFFVFAAIYVFGIVAGIALLEGVGNGVKWSMAFQAIQIPYLSSPFLNYQFVSGFHLTLYVASFGNVGLKTYLGSIFSFYLWSPDVKLSVGVNIVSLSLFYYLNRHRLADPRQMSPEGQTKK